MPTNRKLERSSKGQWERETARKIVRPVRRVESGMMPYAVQRSESRKGCSVKCRFRLMGGQQCARDQADIGESRESEASGQGKSSASSSYNLALSSGIAFWAAS